MSRKRLRFPELSEAAGIVRDEFDSVISVLLFGSMVKGKESPGDVDLCVITDREVPEKWPQIRERFPERAHLTFVSSLGLLNPEETLTRALVHEGFDLIHNCQFSQIFGFKQFTLFTYSLTNLNHSEKTRFMYAFKGRGKEHGLAQKLNARHIGRGVINVPVQHEQEFKDFLNLWKVEYETERILLET